MYRVGSEGSRQHPSSPDFGPPLWGRGPAGTGGRAWRSSGERCSGAGGYTAAHHGLRCFPLRGNQCRCPHGIARHLPVSAHGVRRWHLGPKLSGSRDPAAQEWEQRCRTRLSAFPSRGCVLPEDGRGTSPSRREREWEAGGERANAPRGPVQTRGEEESYINTL